MNYHKVATINSVSVNSHYSITPNPYIWGYHGEDWIGLLIDYEKNYVISKLNNLRSVMMINELLYIIRDSKLQQLSTDDGSILSSIDLQENQHYYFSGTMLATYKKVNQQAHDKFYTIDLEPIGEIVHEEKLMTIFKQGNKYILKAEQVKLGDNGQHYAPLLEFYDFQGNLISEVDVTQLGNQTFGSKSFSDKVGLLLPAHLLLHENKLLFRVGGLKTTMTACVDIPSGKIDWVNEVAALWSQVKDDIVYVCQEGKITKIDIKTGNTLEVLPVLLPDDVLFHLKGQWSFFSIHDGHIYTTYIGEATMMVIHIETGKLVWYDKLPRPDGIRGYYQLSNRPYVYKNRIYAVDSENVLHVWERVKE